MSEQSLRTFLLPLPKSKAKRERLLRAMFSSTIVGEVMELIPFNGVICQRDIVNALNKHSNKTVIKALRELVDTGVVVEEVVETTSPSGRRIKLKCYKLTALGKWLKMLMAKPTSIDKKLLVNEVSCLYRLLGESLAYNFIELSLDPSMLTKELFRGIVNVLKDNSKRSSWDVLVAGSIAVDYHVEVSSGLCNPVYVGLGGSGANIASYMGRLGVSVGLVSSIGLDYDGFYSILALYKDNVDLSKVTVYDDRYTIKTIIVHDGDNVSVRKIVGRLSAIAPNPEEVEWNSINARIYYASDTFLENVLTVGSKALSEDKLFVYAPMKESIEYSPKMVQRILSEYKPMIILNREALEAMKANLGFSPRDLLELSNGVVIVTLDSEGVLLYTKSRVYRYSPPRVKVVDPTGAGDAFIAFTLWRILVGDNVVDAIKWGVVAGAVTVTRLGARTNINDEIVKSLLDSVSIHSVS